MRSHCQQAHVTSLMDISAILYGGPMGCSIDDRHSHTEIVLGMLGMLSQDGPPGGRHENALPEFPIKSFCGKCCHLVDKFENAWPASPIQIIWPVSQFPNRAVRKVWCKGLIMKSCWFHMSSNKNIKVQSNHRP